MKKTGRLSAAENDRVIDKTLAGACLDRPFSARREGILPSDHACLARKQSMKRISFADSFISADPKSAGFALYNAALSCIAAGLRPVQAELFLSFPRELSESRMRNYVKSAKDAADVVGVPFSSVDVIRSDQATAIVRASVIGKRDPSLSFIEKDNKGEPQLLLIGRPAIEGSLLLLNEHEAELGSRYSRSFLDGSKLFFSLFPIAALEAVVPLCEFISIPLEDGIFPALWEFGERLHLGLRAELQRIRLDQLTIEICETLDISPYELKCGGMAIAASSAPEEAAAICAEAGTDCFVIGKLVKGNDRIIINGDEIRYLEPSK